MPAFQRQGSARSWGGIAGWVIALIATALLVMRWLQPSTNTISESIRFDVLPPAGTAFSMLGDVSAAWPVVSPDGLRICFQRRHLAALPNSGCAASIPPKPLRCGARKAHRSRSGRPILSAWVFAADKLRVIDLSAGAPRALADVQGGAQGRGRTGARTGRSSSRRRRSADSGGCNPMAAGWRA